MTAPWAFMGAVHNDSGVRLPCPVPPPRPARCALPSTSPWPTLKEEEEEWIATPRRFLFIAVTKVFSKNAFQHVVFVLITPGSVWAGGGITTHFHVTLLGVYGGQGFQLLSFLPILLFYLTKFLKKRLSHPSVIFKVPLDPQNEAK